MFPFLFPIIPVDYDIPPTLYRIMNSMANFDSEVKTKIRDLALATHEEIFDFNYPLTNKINKADFECLILNHFIMRRIGYETVTAWKIALEVKLNEIMPNYNKLFDMLDGWDLFSSGEVITTSTNELGTTSANISTATTNDNRYSDTPQNRINDIKDGSYMSDYTFNQGQSVSTSGGNDSRSKMETKTRTPSDKIKVYKEFLENKKSIMTMIFKDLESLFYGLV